MSHKAQARITKPYQDCFDCGGRTDLCALDAGGRGPGPPVEICSCAQLAGHRSRCWRGRSFRILVSRWCCGFEQFGMSQARKQEPARWGCNGCWDWAVTARRGRGCTSCAERWCVPAATGLVVIILALVVAAVLLAAQR